jgi:periplasmic divalent cation tolerance protein
MGELLMGRYSSLTRKKTKAIRGCQADFVERGKKPMKPGTQYRVVLVTCGSLMEARKIARIAVSKQLAACVNVFLNPVESFYTWKGKVEKAHEHLLVIKTTTKRLLDLEREVKRLHSYDVPEFIALPIAAGSNDYLSWLQENTKKPRK